MYSKQIFTGVYDYNNLLYVLWESHGRQLVEWTHSLPTRGGRHNKTHPYLKSNFGRPASKSYDSETILNLLKLRTEL
jgi:hypothetical protein